MSSGNDKVKSHLKDSKTPQSANATCAEKNLLVCDTWLLQVAAEHYTRENFCSLHSIKKENHIAPANLDNKLSYLYSEEIPI